MEECIAEQPAVSLLADLRELISDESPEGPAKLRLATDRVIIAAIGRVESTAASRMAAAEAARACRSLAMDLQQSVELHNAATDEALSDARDAAIEALDHFEMELASCAPPTQLGKPRRRVAPRTSSVVMKKRRPMFTPRDAVQAKAEG